MTHERQIAERSTDANQISTKRGFPVYRTNPSVPSTKGLPTRSKRFHVPGGKASMIVDNSTGEIKGIGMAAILIGDGFVDRALCGGAEPVRRDEG